MVDWQEVVEVEYTPVGLALKHQSNQLGLQCPICREQSEIMVAPRITKCGHIYCWPCMLQYLDHDYTKCSLCSESVYRHELRKVTISPPLASMQVTGKEEVEESKEDSNDLHEVEFVLMVRNKSNIISKFHDN